MSKTIKSQELESHRKKIDKIDSQLAALLVERFKLGEAIGQIKREEGLDIVDNDREEEIVNRLVEETGLSRELLTKIYKLIFQESRQRQ